MTITTVLLDIDGTLVDSNDAHAKAWLDTLAEFKFDPDYSAIRTKIGMGGDKLLPSVIGIDPESKLGEQIFKRRSTIFKEKYLPTLCAFPQTRNLLKHMLKIGLQLVVATSASKDDLTSILDQTEISDLLKVRVTSDDAENSKPDPDILQAALKKMKATPEESIMIGDTPYDIEAAIRAHVKSIGFTSGGWGRSALVGAVEIYGGPIDLLAQFNTSLLHRRGRGGIRS